MKTAILVDGGFYRRRAQIMIGEKSAEERAKELDNYCRRHLSEKKSRKARTISYFLLRLSSNGQESLSSVFKKAGRFFQIRTQCMDDTIPR